MVRTSGGIRISAGKSSKKGGGGGNTRSAPSTPNGKPSSSRSSHLPPIPHCEVPSWQKPITNFFNAGAGSSKETIEQPKETCAEEINKENEPNLNNDNETNYLKNNVALEAQDNNTNDNALVSNKQGECS